VAVEDITRAPSVSVRVCVELQVFDRTGRPHEVQGAWSDRHVFHLSAPLTLPEVCDVVLSYMKRQRVRFKDLFAIFDKDKDDRLSERELRALFKFIADEERVGNMMNVIAQAAGDLPISFRDFNALLTSTKQSLFTAGQLSGAPVLTPKQIAV
jgi:hypothetical protein